MENIYGDMIRYVFVDILEDFRRLMEVLYL